MTAAFAAAMILILALAGLFVYVKVRSDLNEALEESLASRADDVSALVTTAGSSAPDLGGERLVEGEDSFAQVLSTDGRVVASTLSAGAGAAITPAEAAGAASEPLSGEREVPGIDGEAKLLARPVTTAAGESIVVVGATTQDRSEALAGLTGAFAIGGPVAILLASLLGYGLAGRALAPIETMRRRAAGITLDRSGERLPLPRADDEVRRLGETLNEMLDRIEASLDRERVFVADASHELRTPLAILRTELELARRPGRSPRGAHCRAGIHGRGGGPPRAPRRGPARDRALGPGAPADQTGGHGAGAPARARARPLRVASGQGGAPDLGFDPSRRRGRARPDCASSRRSETSWTTPSDTARERCSSKRASRATPSGSRSRMRETASPLRFATAPSSASAAPTRAGPAAEPASGSRSSARSPWRTAARRRSKAAGPP